VRREKSNYVIQSVSHALDVLEQFTGDPDELGVTELSKRLKLHKNNVFRLLATLEARGYIDQNKVTENYRLGIRCLRLGQRYVGQTGLLRQARPIMTEVVKLSKETAFLAVMNSASVVPLEAVEAEQPVRLVSRLGDLLPLHCTAAGKMLLALADEELFNSLPEHLIKFTDATITERQALATHLRAVVKQGYALEMGEHTADVHAVAVPVRDYTGTVVGCMTLAGPAYRLPATRIERDLVGLMVKAGADLSARLGFDTSH
jgi:IclR family KDG regulon transcriptional repressor